MIVVNLDVMLAKRKVKSKDLAQAVGITEQNISLIKTGKIKGLRLATLDAICRYLECQPGDILEYQQEGGLSLKAHLACHTACRTPPTPRLSPS